MKITTQQSDFQKALSVVSVCVKGNVTNLQFSSIRMSWAKNEINLEASDIVSGVTVSFGAASEGEGDVYFNPLPIGEYLSTLGSGEITLEVSGEKMVVSMGSSRATFPLVALSDYPRVDLTHAEESKALSVDLGELREAVLWSSVSVASDESRPVLTGVLLRTIDDKTLQIVGSDGYRLSIAKLSVSGRFEKDTLIPQKSLLGFLRDWELGGPVKVWVDEKASRVCFSGGNRSFYIRLIAGDFPDFTRILPQSASLTSVFERADMVAAVRQVALFARQAANTLMCDVGGGKIRLYSKEGQGGQAEAVVETKTTGEPLVLGFNYRYLQEYLKASNDQEVTMSCNGPLAPVQFAGDAKGDKLHIIMPVNVKS